MDMMKERIKLIELTNILDYMLETRNKQEILELIEETIDIIKLFKWGDKMKMQGIKAINWLLYKQYCWRYGLSEGNFKNLKDYVEGRNEP